MEVIYLPNHFQAQNSSYGIWLLTSAAENYSLSKTTIDSFHPTRSELIRGCRICIMTVDSGYQLLGLMITIRADLSSCEKIPANEIYVKLVDPLGGLPSIEILPYFETKTVAGVKLMRKIREKCR